MSSLRDFLVNRPQIERDQPYAFDAPTRTPEILNQGKPSGPQRLTGRELRRLAQFSGEGSPFQRVIEINRFAKVTPVPFSLAVAGVAGAQQIVLAPDRDRVFLSFRNASSSAGTLFIGFDTKPDINNAVFSLVAGGQLIFDVFVPQNDIWIATDTATTFGVVSYSNSDFTY